MSTDLLLGIVIGMSGLIFAFLVFIAIPSRRNCKSNQSFNERSLEQLIIRNGIDEEICRQLERIADLLVRKETK